MINRTRRVTIAILVAILVILGAVLISLILDLSLVENLVMSWIFTVFYSLFAFYLLDTYKIREIVRTVNVPVTNTVIRNVDRPVYINREVPIQIPMENNTVEVVQVPKTVYVEKPVIKRVYIEKHTNRLNIPKYNYIGSTQTRRYHTRNCRLGKLIKRKFKVHSNSQAFFKKKRFKACKICIKKP